MIYSCELLNFKTCWASTTCLTYSPLVIRLLLLRRTFFLLFLRPPKKRYSLPISSIYEIRLRLRYPELTLVFGTFEEFLRARSAWQDFWEADLCVQLGTGWSSLIFYLMFEVTSSIIDDVCAMDHRVTSLRISSFEEKNVSIVVSQLHSAISHLSFLKKLPHDIVPKQRYVTVGSISGLARWQIKRNLATIEWNSSGFSSLSCWASSSEVNNYLFAGEDALFSIFSPNHSIASFNCSIISIYIFLSSLILIFIPKKYVLFF